MKTRMGIALAILFVALTIIPVAAANATVGNTQTRIPIAFGGGWFINDGHRNNFGFVVIDGKLNTTDLWHYMPAGHLTYIGRDMFSQGDMHRPNMIQVIGYKYWRWQFENTSDGLKATIAGWAAVNTGHGWTRNWWFRVQILDMDVKGKEFRHMDEFNIALWKPIGADKAGGWSPNVFNPADPATLKLNATAFYNSFGKLGGGNIEIMP